MKPRQQSLLPELEPTAIQLALRVRQFNDLEEEKAAVNKDFKERLDLLKIQIKQASTAITNSLEDVARVKVVPEGWQRDGSGLVGR